MNVTFSGHVHFLGRALVAQPGPGGRCAAIGRCSVGGSSCCKSRLMAYNWNMEKRDWVAVLAELAESERVLTTAQAARLGVPRDALHDAYESGRLERVAHGAYRLVGSGTSEVDELLALWKLTAPAKFTHERIPEWDGVCVGGTSAAYLDGMGDFYLSPYRMFSRRRINSRRPGVRFGVRRIDRDDVSFDRGFPVTRPERTIVDLVLDREDPSLVAGALKDAAHASAGVNCSRLRDLLCSEVGERKGADLCDTLQAEAGLDDGSCQ